jgi:hypothetical protein
MPSLWPAAPVVASYGARLAWWLEGIGDHEKLRSGRDGSSKAKGCHASHERLWALPGHSRTLNRRYVAFRSAHSP